MENFEWYEYFKRETPTGDGVSLNYFGERHAFDIIDRTADTLTLRRCKVTPTCIPSELIGFGDCGLLLIGDQFYKYEPDPDGYIIHATWNNRLGRFQYHGQSIIAGRHEYRDLNF